LIKLVCFKCSSAAFKYTIDILHKSENAPFSIRTAANHNHIRFINNLSNKGYYCLFKKEFIQSFNNLAPHFISINDYFKSFGESINYDSLVSAGKKNDCLLFVYPNGAIYYLYANALLKFYELQDDITKEELLRVQNKTNTSYNIFNAGIPNSLNEITLIFPIKLLQRFNFL